MVKIRCQDCGRTITVDEGWDSSATCSECGGDFEKYLSKEDTYEEDEVEEEEEEEEGRDEDCLICGEKLEERKYLFWKRSEGYKGELFEEWIGISICKKCIDKKYPRIVGVGKPKTIKLGKSKESKQILDSVL